MILYRIVYRKHFLLFLSFVLYMLITVIIFWHRITNIATHYSMPDVDTDGTIWYYWARIYTEKNQILFELNNLVGYPYGYDYSYIPFQNLIYEINIAIIKLLGGDWQSIILITNISALASYPLAAMSAYILAYYFTQKHYPSFIAGLIFSFSFYHVLMGRGSLSLNHTEFFPLYFLFLFRYLDKRDNVSLILSILMFNLTSLSTLYYGFFSLIFAIIIFIVYGFTDMRYSIRANFIHFVKYFAILGSSSFLINLPVLINQLYVFDPVTAAKFGRIVNPAAELLDPIGYFAPSKFSFIYRWGGEESMWGGSFNVFLGYVGLFLGSIALLIKTKSNRLSRAVLANGLCLILAIAISSRIFGLDFIHHMYFLLFGYFRAVSRMNLFASLFLAILASVTIKEIMKRFYNQNTNRKKQMFLTSILFILLPLWIVLEGLNTNPTWYKTTNFESIYRLYEPIKSLPGKAVIAYPYHLWGGSFPPPYLLLGQIVFEKNIANGLDPQNLRAREFVNKIAKFDDDVVNILKENNINIIIVYTNLININELNKLNNNTNLIYLGHFEAPRDSGYISTNDLSRSIDVFLIKTSKTYNNVSESNYEIGLNRTDVRINYYKYSPYMYIIEISNLTEINKPMELIFWQPFSYKWKLYPWPKDLPDSMKPILPLILPLITSPILEETHQTHNEWANKWIIDPLYIKKNKTIKCRSFGTNITCNDDFKLILYYSGASTHIISILISILTMLALVTLLVIFTITNLRRYV